MSTLKVLLWSNIFLVGCNGVGINPSGASERESVQVSLVPGAFNCYAKTPQVVPIRDSKSWRLVANKKSSFSNIGAQQASPPSFIDAQYFLVRAGERKTAGYRLILSDKFAQTVGNNISLPIKLESPSLGSINAMVITTPCLMVKVSTSKVLNVKVDALGIGVE